MAANIENMVKGKRIKVKGYTSYLLPFCFHLYPLVIVVIHKFARKSSIF